jgi:hypothetical protein
MGWYKKFKVLRFDVVDTGILLICWVQRRLSEVFYTKNRTDLRRDRFKLYSVMTKSHQAKTGTRYNANNGEGIRV